MSSVPLRPRVFPSCASVSTPSSAAPVSPPEMRRRSFERSSPTYRSGYWTPLWPPCCRGCLSRRRPPSGTPAARWRRRWRRWPPLPATGRIFFTTNALEYLRHGGRIGRAAAATGTLLKVKPLIGYKDAGLISDGIAQGRKKSLARVRELFFRYLARENIDLPQYRLATGFGLDRAEHAAFSRTIYDGLLELGCDRPEVLRPYQIGVTIGVHTGPTPIGVGLIRRAISG